jgi:N-acetylneuraminate synthase
VIIVAEIGINHNGDIDIARKLIDMATECGCDAVKFQKRTIDIVYSPEDQAKPRESPWGTTNGDQKRGLEFGKAEFDIIDAHCKDVGIKWFASAWDVPSLEFLRQYDCPYNKIASPMLTHHGFVDAVIAEGKETFVSTGMTDLVDVLRVVDKFDVAACPFVLMHCVSTYPTPDADLNLRAIKFLRQIHYRVGYSGHESGPMPSIVAAAFGAQVIERHITLDRSMYGSDQSASLERRGLEVMVSAIRALPLWLGDGMKRVTLGERECANKLRYFEAA